MDRLRSMEVFVSSVDLGSFTAAARVYKITPAMVSKHINALEQRLGATLLARTTRTHKLTEIGQKFYANCKQILGQVADAEAGAEAMAGTPKGNLRINAPVWLGPLMLAPIICDYLQQYPEVNIELSLTDRYIDIVDEGFDVAIRIGELQDSSLLARKLAMFEMAICASPDYIRLNGLPTKPADFVQHQCLGFTNWLKHSGWKQLGSQLDTKIEQTPRFKSDNIDALRIAALKGIGIVMMPKALLKPEIEAGRLIEVLPERALPARSVYAVYPRERQLAPKLATFVDFLLKSHGIKLKVA